MNTNNNLTNQTVCVTGGCYTPKEADNNYGLCAGCERERRVKAVDEIFARHAGDLAVNADETAGGGGSPRCREIETQTDACRRCGNNLEPNGKCYDCEIKPKPPTHDDCMVCMDSDVPSWTRMMCGHEVCTPCHTGLQQGEITSQTSVDRYQIGECPNDVICPMCRAINPNNDPVELHQRLNKYRQRINTIRSEHSRIASETMERREAEIRAIRRASENEAKRLREKCEERDRDIADLRLRIAEMERQPARPVTACSMCRNPYHEDTPYCLGCMEMAFGEDWAKDNGVKMATPARVSGEQMVVKQRYGPDIAVASAGGGGAPERIKVGGGGTPRAVMVGGGGAETQRRPCQNPGCETPKNTQRRCPHHENTPCCKRCDRCRVCKGV